MLILLKLIFLASVILAFSSTAFGVLRYGRSSYEFQLCLLVLVYLLLCYFAGFIGICFNPYWIDNEMKEFIPLSERWSWAFPGATVFEIIMCPLLILGCSFLRHSRVHHATQIA